MIDIYPVVVEGYFAENTTCAFRIKTFDEGACEVEIKTLVNSDSWEDISKAIKTALVMMEKGGEVYMK